MTDDIRDVLRRCRVQLKYNETPEGRQALADIDRLLAADETEDAKYHEEAKEAIDAAYPRIAEHSPSIGRVARWLKARDARRKDGAK